MCSSRVRFLPSQERHKEGGIRMSDGVIQCQKEDKEQRETCRKKTLEEQSSEGSWKKQETGYKKRSLGWKGRG